MSRTGRQCMLLASFLGLATAVGGAAIRTEPFHTWLYQLAWLPLLVAADSALALREGRSALFAHPRFAASLFCWSAPVWFLFELANFRLANWYYVFLPRSPWARWAGTVLAFSTVLPALYLAYRWMAHLRLAASLRGRPFAVRRNHLRALLALGASFVVLSLTWPDAFFPLIWGSATLILEPWNHRRDPTRSLFGDLSRGNYMRVVRLLLGGLAVGLVWELFNSLAAARWIYTVPGLETAKLFEMPLPGFLGFPVLALDAFVMYQTLVLGGLAVAGWHLQGRPTRLRWPRLRIAIPAASVLCLAVLFGADRLTVDSLRPSLEVITGVDSEVFRRLRSAGIRSVSDLAAAEPPDLRRAVGTGAGETRRLVREARMAMLRGVGTEHASALQAAGISGVCALAAADPRRIESTVRRADPRPYAGRPARVRVWLRAARARCPAGSDRAPPRTDQGDLALD